MNDFYSFFLWRAVLHLISFSVLLHYWKKGKNVHIMAARDPTGSKKACTLVKYFCITQYHLLLLEPDLPDSIKYLLWRLGHLITAHGNSEQQSVSVLGSQWTGIFFSSTGQLKVYCLKCKIAISGWRTHTHTQFGSWSLHQVLNQFLLMDSHTHINSHKGWPRGEEIELAVCNAAPCVCNQRRLRIQDHCKTLWSMPGEPVTAGGSCSYHQIWL